MKSCKKLKLCTAMLLTVAASLVFSVCAYAEENPTEAIVTTSDKAMVGNGTPGIAVVASYNDDGSLKKIVSKPVVSGEVAILDVSPGDKIMYLESLQTLKPVTHSVTVQSDTLSADKEAIFEAAVEKALVEALGKDKGKNMTELQKALHIHDWIILNCQYNQHYDPDNYRAYGIIVKKTGVCSGYSKAYQELLARVGIEAYYISGLVYGDDPHAWNVVKIDGKYYCTDVTWDDPVPDEAGRIRRDYFMKTGATFESGTSIESYGHHPHDSYKKYTDKCTDDTYEKNELISSSTTLIWDEDKEIYYYVDMDKVKTTDASFSGTLTKGTIYESILRPSSVFMTEDKNYICFFRPIYGSTKEASAYIYSIGKNEYYTYTVKASNAPYCKLSQNGNNINVLVGKAVIKSLPLPPINYERRKVTFDQNYEGGVVTSCYYIDNYWTNGDGSFDTPTRKNVDFRGWYTKKDGGTKVENFDEINGDDVTLYAHWWGDWSITKEPTLTETGIAARPLETNSEIKDEFILPVLSDTSFWKVATLEPTFEREGQSTYTSDYGKVNVTLPKKTEYTITHNENGDCWDYYLTVVEWGDYYIVEDIDGESVIYPQINATLMWADIGPGTQFDIRINKQLQGKTGTLTIKVYNSDRELVCEASFEIK